MVWRYDNTNNANNANLYYDGVLTPTNSPLLMFPRERTIMGIKNANSTRPADSRDESTYINGLLPDAVKIKTGNVGIREKHDSRVIKQDFGDGYSQVTPDGLNTDKQNWQLEWYLPKGDETESLVNFFEHVGDHTPFIWNAYESIGFDRLYAVIVQGSFSSRSDPSDVNRVRISAVFNRWFYAGSESLLGGSSDG